MHFFQTDVSLPGNSSLPVSMGRRRDAGWSSGVYGHFGEWESNVPRLSATYSSKNGWVGRSDSGGRCSNFGVPAQFNVSPVGPSFSGWAYWSGVFLHAPGAEGAELLSTLSADSQPSDGNNYPLSAAGNWKLRCLASIANGSGEGFLALSPEGVQYRFDWMASRKVAGLSAGLRGGMERSEFWLMPTLITDRFGNTVSYSYDAANPWKLLRIEASDGRRLTMSYVPGSGVGGEPAQISSVSDGTRTWTYQYSSAPALKSVSRPDGSQWQFQLEGLDPQGWQAVGDTNICDDIPAYPPSPDFTGTITHPSGAVGRFVTRWVNHQRYKTPNKCWYVGPGDATNQARYDPYPRTWWTQSLAEKHISGPGLDAQRWTYAWQDNGSAVGTKQVLVTDPLNQVTRHTYGATYNLNEAQQLGIDEGWNGSTALRSTQLRYRATNAAPYYDSYGISALKSSNPLSTMRRPVDRKEVLQQGISFLWEASAFDTFARPISVTRSSSLGYSRTETSSYFDHSALWVLGQIANISSAGLVMLSNDYDPSKATLSATRRFGVLQHSFGYHPDGNLASRTDGRLNSTTFASYKRGVPQSVRYPNGASESAVVNDLAQVISLSDAAGYTTGYGYDAMGRLASITPPSGWAASSLTFEPVSFEEFGLAAGHWRLTVSQGNARHVSYYDALWRPVMTRSFDAADEAGTRKVSVTQYDALGRIAYQSYPQRDAASVNSALPAGRRSSYDALNRPLLAQADSELGVLNTSTLYLGGFLTQTTNPRNKVSTQGFQAFDSPDEARLASVSAPAGVSLSVARDSFGKPTGITRSGSYNGQAQSLTRRYVYDTGQRLCKTVEPEIGATVQDYDAAGNLAWRAPGQNLPGANSCDTASVPAAAKISYTYSALNQLQNTSYGDGSPGVTRSYTPDGLLQTVASNGATWTYGYNSLRLLSSETLNYGGQNYALGWGYDSLGNLSSLTYPNNSSVAYSTNALGQARAVSGYASAVSHHPNGAVAGYTLANGIAHSLSQNTRGLPLLNRDAGVLQDLYAYDANGNVSSITDQQEGVFSRTLGYDDLDRLISANAANVWGNASYGYDALDNLRSAVVGTRNSTLNIDAARNLLSSVVTNGGSTLYGYDVLGNLRSKGQQSFGFDLGNRLTTSSLGGSYAYDGLGRRIKVQSSDGSTRMQVYSQAGQLLWATSSGGPRPASSTAYVYLGGKQIAETSNGVTQYVHTDGLGSPVAHTNSSGAILNRSRFEPYGYVAQGTKPSAGTSVIGFTGHVQDAETDLVYMQQRYYDPIAGRFLSVDPVMTDAATGKSFGRYHYGENNPYKFVDSDGRAPHLIDEDRGGVRAGSADLLSARGLDGGPVRQSVQTSRANLVEARNELSQRAATREAKRLADIPTSQQPVSQTSGRAQDGTQVGRQQTFEVPKAGGGTEAKSVQVSRDQVGSHAGMPQIEAGKVKPGGQVDSAGRPRIQNEGKVRVDFEPKKKQE
ncbi:RHS repeat domain-containing protein [Paucibacter soli]|uniref:RHS repeat domain-containing protein n=1 Tax=Paucibacter soli TaxID=3133433 RepID=UPI0030B1FB6E